MNAPDSFSSIDGICEQLKQNRYISDQSLATVVYLSYHLHKPLFLEGEPGVGKTEVALVLSELLEAKEKGKNTWTRWYDRMGSFFEKRFGKEWKKSDQEFWEKFPFY